ncbi:hypothetical protein C8R44DRAFT_756751 [Mycena epipterygia]|nr:hypothetical protein C8R44DRAFT_756751 [Mycena epipterygia]
MFGLAPCRILAAAFLLSTTVGVSAQQTNTGPAFVFHPGTGACSESNIDTDVVASVSETYWLANPNSCNRNLVATANGQTVTGKIVDVFTDTHWGEYGIGCSPAMFSMLNGSYDAGNISSVSWFLP